MNPQIHSADWVTARVLLELALVTAACVVARWLLRKRNQPPVIAEILAGLALGPCVLGYLPGDLPRTLFPVETRPFLMILANVGLVLFMFVVGFEIDVPALRGLRGSATSVAAASVLVPLAVGMALTWWIRPVPASTSGPAATQLVQALFIGVAFSATAFPVLARILNDTGLKRLHIRGLALSAAAAGDVVSWTLLAAVVAMTRRAGGASTVILLLEFVGLLLALRYVARPVVIAVLSRNRIDQAGSALAMSLLLVGIFLSSCATAAMHLHPIFGAFAFGFACPRDVVCGKAPEVVEKLADASKILMPVFFVLTGLSMSVRDFGAHDALVTVLVIISASAAKILSVYATARACRLSSQDSWGLGLLMNTRGLTELVILDVGRTAGVLSNRMFTVLAVMAIGTTLITGPVMEKIYFSDTNRSAWSKRWRGKRGQVKSTSPVVERLSDTSAGLGNRYVGAWPFGSATPDSSHHLDGESVDSQPRA
ncbi:cation:proton antiporter [Jatrophihabitans sp.]|jgi:Kef-type K+ transport system membrane component KefB|uniref:cation:proton antiporter n=1 Tax=Jatrophihabitans sp. TaxID=1932789 RepID=UPI002EE2258D